MSMSDTQLIEQINSLPDDLKKQVEDFVFHLSKQEERSSKHKKRPFGHAKGAFTMHDDFDGPLEDFIEYTK